ncbi:MAG: LysM peptidoglycan-binding domain-containing protein [Anaerolineales bacterium]|nr:LysM peptidoglycan-binding domain-containing protein [Anaerolineales bacterium]
MSLKSFTQMLVISAILLASFASPGNVRASSSCGSTYVVQPGDWLSTIADRCGVTLAQMYAANPGIGYYIYPGQVLVIPGGGYSGSSSGSYASTYTVQYGDTFAKIASRYGVSVNSLWAANPHIWDINRIYAGQVIYVPGSSWVVGSSSTEPSADLSYGTVPAKASFRTIKLVNYANADVYVSLQGITATDKVNVTYEYSVDGSRTVSVPVGQYHYVAWVGGKEFVGDFKLREGVTLSMKFYPDRVNVH